VRCSRRSRNYATCETESDHENALTINEMIAETTKIPHAAAPSEMARVLTGTNEYQKKTKATARRRQGRKADPASVDVGGLIVRSIVHRRGAGRE
jgi:hypothetical protein